MKIKLLMILISCAQLSSCAQDFCDDFLYTLSTLQENRPEKKSDNYDFSKFNDMWEIVTLEDMNGIKKLLQFKGDSERYFDCEGTKSEIGYVELRTSYRRIVDVVNNDIDIAALHMINAIYYDDYYFASDRILYDSTNLEFDEFCNCKVRLPNKRELVDPGIRYNRLDEVAEAWKVVDQWYERNKDKSLDDIRAAKDRPLNGSSFFWYGEKGGPVNQHYPGTFSVNHPKSNE